MPRKNAKVQKVFDGDTFRIDRKIRGTDRIRLNKINAPEKGRPGPRRAANITKRMIEGKRWLPLIQLPKINMAD